MSAGTAQQTLDDAVSWAAEVLGTRVTRVRSLTGGLSAGMAGLETTAGPYALRWWEEPDDWPEICLIRQRALLGALAETDLPVPRLVVDDATRPAALTTWLPGEIDLDPADPQAWLRALADTLVAIHGVPTPPGLPPSDSVGYQDRDRDLGWLDDAGLAAEARAVMASGTSDPPVLLHGDYQHFNVVWIGGRLSGVIDWPMGGLGDRGLDVGHCRLNLAVLYDAATAMAFLDRYEAVAGRRVSAAADLGELLLFAPAWFEFIPKQVAGRRPVDLDGMAARVKQTLVETLRRAG